jgi:hypothetical protein
MSNTIFVIKNDDGIIAFYADLEKAKNELKNIYNRTPDYKYDNYHIAVYNLIDNEYINSQIIYTYTFNHFSTKICV